MIEIAIPENMVVILGNNMSGDSVKKMMLFLGETISKAFYKAQSAGIRDRSRYFGKDDRIIDGWSSTAEEGKG